VVLDAEDHPSARRARNSPHVDGIHDVPKVQVTCR
jgi:hypothetical protein